MSLDLLKRLGLFLGLCMAQILILNHIHLFGVAIPLLYVYFVITFHRNTPKWAILLWCFAMGAAVDAFANTPGVGAASLTLIGALQPYFLELFLPRDMDAHAKASAATMGFTNFSRMSFLLVLIFCIVFFLLEQYSLFNVLYWLESVGGSALLTFLLILPIERIRK